MAKITFSKSVASGNGRRVDVFIDGKDVGFIFRFKGMWYANQDIITLAGGYDFPPMTMNQQKREVSVALS